MKIQIVLLAAVSLLTACTQNKKEQQDPNPTEIPTPTPTTATYLSIQGKDTTRLTLQTTKGSISGSLDILTFEKDSRRGTIENGQMKGDTLYAVYNSTQEGQQCACEIAFLKRGSDYVMTNDIFGENNYQYNTEYTKGHFKDRKQIVFDGKVLKEVPSK